MCQPHDAGLAHWSSSKILFLTSAAAFALWKRLLLYAFSAVQMLLSQYVFSSAAITTIAPDEDAAGFDAYLRQLKKALAVAREAVAQI